MTEEQRSYMHARDKFVMFHLGPAKALLEATATLVNLATARAEEVQKTMDELRPVWAQGFTSDSVAAQANGAALAQLWKMLEVDNQTAAVAALEELRKELKTVRLAAQYGGKHS